MKEKNIFVFVFLAFRIIKASVLTFRLYSLHFVLQRQAYSRFVFEVASFLLKLLRA